jgi:hypothetical protein
VVNPTQDTVTHWGLTWPQILTLAVALFGVFFALPNLLRYLEERFKKKRQDAVRVIILNRGAASKGDMMHDGMKDIDATKAINELHLSGEIVPSEDVGGRVIWRFKIHPHSVEPRYKRLG